MRVAYLVHDLADPAVSRRVRMLQAGGAEVKLIGFRRNDAAVEAVAGASATDLGRTHDLRLAGRAASVLRARINVRQWSPTLAGADAILARNLEMLLLADAGRRAAASSATLTYELLDVHRLLASRSAAGVGLRAIEANLLRRTDLTLISSPAFATSYFEPWARPVRRTLVVENKVFDPEGAFSIEQPARAPGPPWRIGWYGMLRCQRSLDILCGLARDARGLVHVDIRGRPTYALFDDFVGQVTSAPNVTFGGPYNPADVSQLYGSVHFAWSIDFFEEGLNSSWLLPNRLYEGQLFGAVPLALRKVETGRWLAKRGAGLLLDDPQAELLPSLTVLTPESYQRLAQWTADIPRGDLSNSRSDCEALVHALGKRPA